MLFPNFRCSHDRVFIAIFRYHAMLRLMETQLIIGDRLLRLDEVGQLTGNSENMALLVHLLPRSVSFLSGWKPPSHWLPGFLR